LRCWPDSWRQNRRTNFEEDDDGNERSEFLGLRAQRELVLFAVAVAITVARGRPWEVGGIESWRQ
jgi:hypothetical protein